MAYVIDSKKNFLSSSLIIQNLAAVYRTARYPKLGALGPHPARWHMGGEGAGGGVPEPLETRPSPLAIPNNLIVLDQPARANVRKSVEKTAVPCVRVT